jgi:hypothetical protein
VKGKRAVEWLVSARTFPARLEPVFDVESTPASMPRASDSSAVPTEGAREVATVHLARPANDFSVTVQEGPAQVSFCIHIAPAGESSRPTPPDAADGGPDALSHAAKLLQLLSALDSDKRLRKAQPLKVFNLYYRRRLAVAEIARQCRCHPTLVFRRLATIRKNLPWTPQQLRELSPHVEAMEDALSCPQAASIYRPGAVHGDRL